MQRRHPVLVYASLLYGVGENLKRVNRRKSFFGYMNCSMGIFFFTPLNHGLYG